MRKIVVLFFLIYSLTLQANYAQVYVPVTRYQNSQYYSIPSYHHFLVRTIHDHNLQKYLKIQKLNNEAHTKYYTDAAYRKKIDAFNQLIFNCNSFDKFVRILARYQLLTYQFKGPHAFLVEKIKNELAQRYFDKSGKLINFDKIDHKLGAIVDNFFKNVFNHEMYLNAHNILHDDASLEIISREKKGFLGYIFSVLGSTFKAIPDYLGNFFESGCTLNQAINSDYNKQLIKLIKLLQKGEFDQAEQLLIADDQLMKEMWWSRETICQLSGGQLPKKHLPSSLPEILVSTKTPECEIKSLNINFKALADGEHIECANVANDCLNARRQALQESVTCPYHAKAEYQFSHDVKLLLREQKISPLLYRFCLGNQLQQVLHQEFLQLLTIFSKLKHTISRVTNSHFLTSQFVSSVDLGREHNQLGFIKKAILFANLSWGLLEHAAYQLFKAEDECFMSALEGSLQGIAHFFNTILDPVGTYNNFVEMAHSLGSIAEKIIIECDPDILYTKEQHEELWEKRWQKIAAASSTLKEKFSKMSLRDLARFSTSAAVETILIEKAMSTFAKLFTEGTKELANLSNKINEISKAMEVAATAADGISVETRTSRETSKQVAYVMEKPKEGFSKVRNSEKNCLQYFENRLGKTIKKFPREILEKYRTHIFSEKHKLQGIMRLGESENDILRKFVDIILIADKNDLLKIGSNQIHSKINNFDVVIRLFIDNNQKVLSINGFTGTSQKTIGNLIEIY